MATTTISELKRQGVTESSLIALLAQRDYIPKFDADAWHVMQERDNAMIRDEIMHGYASRSFVYEFDIKGKLVRGVSVVGARELASQYKGIKHRIIATIEKRGALFIFRSFDPISITTQVLNDLADDDDYYECIVEISDIKTGNSIQCRKKENRMERKRDGGLFQRPHYDVIAESKAFRNGVLSILPQNVIKDFETRCVQAGNKSDERTIDQLRAGVAAFAAKHGIHIDRRATNGLSYAELSGLGVAARSGNDDFIASASALGIIAASSPDTPKDEDPKKPPAPEYQDGSDATPQWAPTPEEQEAIRLREAAEAAEHAEGSSQRQRGRSRNGGTME